MQLQRPRIWLPAAYASRRCPVIRYSFLASCFAGGHEFESNCIADPKEHLPKSIRWKVGLRARHMGAAQDSSLGASLPFSPASLPAASSIAAIASGSCARPRSSWPGPDDGRRSSHAMSGMGRTVATKRFADALETVFRQAVREILPPVHFSPMVQGSSPWRPTMIPGSYA